MAKLALASKAKEDTTVADLSVQPRAEPGEVPSGLAYSFWFSASGEEEISGWWSEERDRDLRDFWMRPGNDILAGAVSSMVKKFKAMSWVIEGPERVVNRCQPVLAEAEFGAGWGTLLGKTLTDFLTQDKGAFWELVGRGKTDGPIEGPVLGVAHLDAAQCQLTGDTVYPVLYRNPKQGLSHKLHATRVVHMADMPSPNEAMKGIGFCATSRVVTSSRILLRLAQYKEEKLSDLPEAGLLLLNNILPMQWEDQKAEYHRERRRLGHEIWTNVLTLIGMDPAEPVSAEFISFAGLPDAFDERSATDIYVNIVALAFGVDVREFWPMSAGPLGTAAETLIMHQKARGKGVGDVISTLERAINWKVLPASCSFKFDFRDDEEDAQQAEIAQTRAKTIMDMWVPPKSEFDRPPVSRLEIRQMLADNVPYFKEEFLEVDVTEEVEATDVEREKMYGPTVTVDEKGIARRPRKRRGEALERTGEVLDVVARNYRAGRIGAEELASFALAELVDKGTTKL